MKVALTASIFYKLVGSNESNIFVNQSKLFMKD